MKTHLHHKIPQSRGGTNDEWNLEELSPYEHALTHALDFVLFSHSPMFDFRHPAWPLLPEDLQIAVKAEMKNRYTGLHKLHEERLPDGRSKQGVENVKRMHSTKLPDGRSKVAYNSKVSYREPIVLQDLSTGLEIVFESIQTAAKMIGVPATNICKVLKGRRKSIKNYSARYAMSQSTFYVKLINKGRTIETTVQAHTQPEARKFAENLYPGYKAMSAQRIS